MCNIASLHHPIQALSPGVESSSCKQRWGAAPHAVTWVHFMDFHSTKALPTPPRLWPHSVQERTNLSVRKRLLPWSSSSTTTLPRRPTPSHLNFRVSLQRLTIILHYFYNISRRRTQRRTSHTAPPRMSLRDTTQRWKHFATRCYFGSVKGCRFLALIETCLSLYLFI